MRGRQPASQSPQSRGLRKITLLVPAGCAEGLLHLASELRARQRAGTAGATLEWRRLSPSAELMVDLRSGARCAIRDTGAPGVGRYHWTVTVFGEHKVAAGRTGQLAEAQSQAEAALAVYMVDWREPSGGNRGDA
jgi:hypothetical protein